MTRPSFETVTPPSPDNLVYGDFPVKTKSVVIGASQTLVRGAVLGRVNKRITLTLSATGGTFTLTVDGETTSAIAYNATADDIADAIVALTSMNAGDVAVTGAGPFTIQYTGDRAGQDITTTASGASLTGGAGTAVIASVATGGRYVASAPSATDGSQHPVAILAEDVTTAADETATVTIYEAGHFNVGDVGFGACNANAVTNDLRALGIHLSTSATV